MSKEWQKFFLSIIRLSNEIIYNGLDYLNIIKLDLIFTDSQIYELLMNSHQYYINIDLLIELNRYYILKTFYERFNIKDLNKMLRNFYSANKKDIHENRSFVVRDIINEINQDDAKQIENSADFLINLLSNFTINIKDLSSSHRLSVKKLLVANFFYEQCVIRPVYLFLNVFDDRNTEYKKYLEGKHYYKLTLIITLYLKVSLFFAEFFNEIYLSLKNDIKQKLLFEAYDSSIIATSFSKEYIHDLKNNLVKITEEKIKYYEYATLIDICRRIMGRSLKIKNKEPDPNFNKYIKQIDSAFQHYDTKLNKTKDRNLSMIKELDSGDESINHSKILLEYLLNHMITIIDYNRFSIKKNLVTEENKKSINLDTFKFENSYALIFLNKLIINDSRRLQNILIREKLATIYSYVNYLSRYFIFGNLLYEISLTNEIDYETNRSSLIYDLFYESIKFIQNLCEGHNHLFQDLLFNYSLNDEEEIFSPSHQCSLKNVVKKSKSLLNVNNDLDQNLPSFKTIREGKVDPKNLSQTITGSIDSKNLCETTRYIRRSTLKREDLKIIKEVENDHYEGKIEIPLKSDNYNKSIIKGTLRETFDRNLFKTMMPGKFNPEIEEFECSDSNDSYSESPQFDPPIGKPNFNQTNIIKNHTVKELVRKMRSVDSLTNNNPNMLIQEDEDVTDENDSKSDDEQSNYFSRNFYMDPNDNEYKNKLLDDENSQKNRFLNFIQLQMKLIFFYVQKGPSYKDFSRIVSIFKLLNDLVIEMVQGTRPENVYNFFYEKIQFKNKGSGLKCSSLDKKLYEYFAFLRLNEDIRDSIFHKKDLFNKNTIKIKIAMFKQINNLINVVVTNNDLINILVLLYESSQLITLVGKYLTALYVKYILGHVEEDEEFYDKFFGTELQSKHLSSLIDTFKTDYRMYYDEYFILSSEIFLYLMIIGNRFKINDVNNFLNTSFNEDNSITKESKTCISNSKINDNKKVADGNLVHSETKRKLNEFELNEQRDTRLYNMVISKDSLVICSKFYQSFILNCDFSFPSKDLNMKNKRYLKRIYFITDPRVFLLSKQDISYMIQQLDIRDDTAKIKFMFEQLHYFFNEVEYKSCQEQSSKIMQYLNDFNYIIVDKINFLFSIFINLYLLIMLNNFNLIFELNLVYYLEIIQITINIVFLILFFYSKYFKYVILETSKDKTKKDGFIDKVNIYLFKCLINNNEVYLLILNLIIGLVIMIRPTYIFLFCLQLLAVIKFVPTIKGILMAFKLRISQLLQMIVFLIILTNFYANVSYYYLREEFNIELNDVFNYLNIEYY